MPSTLNTPCARRSSSGISTFGLAKVASQRVCIWIVHGWLPAADWIVSFSQCGLKSAASRTTVTPGFSLSKSCRILSVLSLRPWPPHHEKPISPLISPSAAAAAGLESCAPIVPTPALIIAAVRAKRLAARGQCPFMRIHTSQCWFLRLLSAHALRMRARLLLPVLYARPRGVNIKRRKRPPAVPFSYARQRRAGRRDAPQFMEIEHWTKISGAEILDTVAKLRVTDIRDGMDWVGLHHVGTVDPEIRPLWRTKAAGFAQTYRHIPTKERVPELAPEDYTKWAYEYWYAKLWDMGDFRDQVGDGDFLVDRHDGAEDPGRWVDGLDGLGGQGG